MPRAGCAGPAPSYRHTPERPLLLRAGRGDFPLQNYFFQGGSPLPWINAGNAFNEGVDIDSFILLLSITLLLVNLGVMTAGMRALHAGVRRQISWVS